MRKRRNQYNQPRLDAYKSSARRQCENVTSKGYKDQYVSGVVFQFFNGNKGPTYIGTVKGADVKIVKSKGPVMVDRYGDYVIPELCWRCYINREFISTADSLKQAIESVITHKQKQYRI